MRIPAEALLPYPADSGRFADAPGTRPVPSSATLTGQLPESLPHSLMLGVRGIKSRIRLDFDRNMAVVEGKGEE